MAHASWGGAASARPAPPAGSERGRSEAPKSQGGALVAPPC